MLTPFKGACRPVTQMPSLPKQLNEPSGSVLDLSLVPSPLMLIESIV